MALRIVNERGTELAWQAPEGEDGWRTNRIGLEDGRKLGRWFRDGVPALRPQQTAEGIAEMPIVVKPDDPRYFLALASACENEGWELRDEPRRMSAGEMEDDLRRRLGQTVNKSLGQRRAACELLIKSGLFDEVEIPEFIGEVLAGDALEKGAGHKYTRRVPKSGGGYRYFYKVAGGAGGIGHESEFVVGAAFKVSHDNKAGHFHITAKADDGTLTIKHDESGQVQTLPPAALTQMLMHEHAEGIASHKAKLAADLAQVAKTGSAKQKAKIAAEAAKAPAGAKPEPAKLWQWGFDHDNHASKITGHPVRTMSIGDRSYQIVPSARKGQGPNYFVNVSVPGMAGSLDAGGKMTPTPVTFETMAEAAQAVVAHEKSPTPSVAPQTADEKKDYYASVTAPPVEAPSPHVEAKPGHWREQYTAWAAKDPGASASSRQAWLDAAPLRAAVKLGQAEWHKVGDDAWTRNPNPVPLGGMSQVAAALGLTSHSIFPASTLAKNVGATIDPLHPAEKAPTKKAAKAVAEHGPKFEAAGPGWAAWAKANPHIVDKVQPGEGNRGTVNLAGPDKAEKLYAEAEIHGQYAVHANLGSKTAHTVTHIPTGKAAAVALQSEDVARDLARQLAKEHPTWGAKPTAAGNPSGADKLELAHVAAKVMAARTADKEAAAKAAKKAEVAAKKTGAKTKGTPTWTNHFALEQAFKEAGGTGIIGKVAQVHAAHVKRLIAAGYLEPGEAKGTWRLSDAGKAAHGKWKANQGYAKSLGAQTREAEVLLKAASAADGHDVEHVGQHHTVWTHPGTGRHYVTDKRTGKAVRGFDSRDQAKKFAAQKEEPAKPEPAKPEPGKKPDLLSPEEIQALMDMLKDEKPQPSVEKPAPVELKNRGDTITLGGGKPAPAPAPATGPKVDTTRKVAKQKKAADKLAGDAKGPGKEELPPSPTPAGGSRSAEGLKVIAIGPKGGKIVGYTTKDGKRKAIYEGSEAAKQLAATVEQHATPEPHEKPAAPADAPGGDRAAVVAQAGGHEQVADALGKLHDASQAHADNVAKGDREAMRQSKTNLKAAHDAAKVAVTDAAAAKPATTPAPKPGAGVTPPAAAPAGAPAGKSAPPVPKVVGAPAPAAPKAKPVPAMDTDPLAPDAPGGHGGDPADVGRAGPAPSTRSAEHAEKIAELQKQVEEGHEKLKALQHHVTAELVPMFNKLKAQLRQQHRDPHAPPLIYLLKQIARFGAFVLGLHADKGSADDEIAKLDHPGADTVKDARKQSDRKASVARSTSAYAKAAKKAIRKSLGADDAFGDALYIYLQTMRDRVGKSVANIDTAPLAKASNAAYSRADDHAAGGMLEALAKALPDPERVLMKAQREAQAWCHRLECATLAKAANVGVV